MNITHNNNCYANNSSYSQDQKNLEDHASRNAFADHPSSETPLFKRQEGAAQFIIQREGSGQLKAFLEEADGSRFPILLKGFPDRIASNQTKTFRQLFAHTPIKRTGLFADFSCGLLGGMYENDEMNEWAMQSFSLMTKLPPISPLYNKLLIASALDLGEEELDKRPSKGPLAAYILGKSLAKASMEEFINFIKSMDYSLPWNNLQNILVFQIRDLFRIPQNEDLEAYNPDSNGKFERYLPSDASQIKQIQEKLAILFLNASASFEFLMGAFIPAQYALAIRPSKVLKEMGIEKPSEYFFEALCKGHWEAVRDIQFMGVFDPGLVGFIKDIYNIRNTDCNSILSSFPRIAHLKELLTGLQIITTETLGNIGLDLTTVDNQISSFLGSYRQDALTQDQVPQVKKIVHEIFNTTSSQVQLIKGSCQGEHYKNQELSSIHYYLDLIYSELAQAALVVQVDALKTTSSKDNSEAEAPIQIYKSTLIYENEVRAAENYIKQIQDPELKKYTYLELAKSAAIFNRLDIRSAHTGDIEKIIKHFIKKSDNIPELAYYLLIKGAVDKILFPDISSEENKLYFEKYAEYLSKIGPLGNLAMFEIQKKVLSLKLNEANNNSIKNEFTKKIERWTRDYFDSNKHAEFINKILIHNLLNWSFSTEYIKLNLFIHKFFFEGIMEDETITEDIKQAILAEAKNALEAKFDSYYNLNIKPKLTLKLKRKEQFTQFKSKKYGDKNNLNLQYSLYSKKALKKKGHKEEAIAQAKLIQNYSPLVKKISEDTIALVKELCENIKQSLGTPPTNFEIFTLGSLARRESGFYTDFEVGVVLQENSIAAQIYFEKFSQKLADSLFMLEEHPDVGMHGAHLDTADNAPPHKRFEFRDLSEDQIMNKIRNAIGHRRKGDVPTAGSRIYLLAADDFVNLFKHNALEGLDASSIELNSFYNQELQAIKAVFYQYLVLRNKSVDISQKNDFKKSINLQAKTYDDLKQIFNAIPPNSRISECFPDLLQLAKKEIKKQLVKDYIEYDSKIKNVDPTQLSAAERLRLTKETLPYVKKILNPLSSGEIGVARSVPDLGRNIDIVYSYTAPGEIKNFDLIQNRNDFFSKKIPCQNLGIKINDPWGIIKLGPLKQGQYVSFKAIIELLYNRAFKEKLFTDTFDLSLDSKLPLHLIQKLNKGKAAKILPKKIDLKRAFYRIPEQILTGLSWFFREAIEAEASEAELNKIDTFQHYLSIIDLLYQANIFSEDLKREFEFLMNLGVKFRLQQQQKLKGECNEIYLHEETWRKELADQDATIKVLKDSLDRWACLYSEDYILEDKNDYTDTLKNYLEALKKKSYLEKVGPDIFEPEEKMLFAQGFHSLKHIVDLTEKWIKNVQKGDETEGLDGFPNA